MNNEPTFRTFGTTAVLIEWEPQINEELNTLVVSVNSFLLNSFSSEILETVPSYYSIAVYVKVDVDVNKFLTVLQTAYGSSNLKISEEKHIVTIPVCYDQEFAIDMKTVSKYSRLTNEEIVSEHTKSLYKAFFLGFLPGFAYLGGLNKQLMTPRKSMPRPRVVAGSVGIGGGQTGIYPIDSPGGWNIIGKTPILLFDPTSESPTIIKAGDWVRFKSISKAEFDLISVAIATDTYKVEREVRYD